MWITEKKKNKKNLRGDTGSESLHLTSNSEAVHGWVSVMEAKEESWPQCIVVSVSLSCPFIHHMGDSVMEQVDALLAFSGALLKAMPTHTQNGCLKQPTLCVQTSQDYFYDI